MARRVVTRWNTRFARWVSGYGVTRLAATLATQGDPITPKAIYDWISGDGVPRPPRAMSLVRISHGTLTLEDVFRHRDEVRCPATEREPETITR